MSNKINWRREVPAELPDVGQPASAVLYDEPDGYVVLKTDRSMDGCGVALYAWTKKNGAMFPFATHDEAMQKAPSSIIRMLSVTLAKLQADLPPEQQYVISFCGGKLEVSIDDAPESVTLHGNK